MWRRRRRPRWCACCWGAARCDAGAQHFPRGRTRAVRRAGATCAAARGGRYRPAGRLRPPRVAGEQLQAWGISIAFTTVAVVVAQSFVALPFLVISVEGAAHGGGRRGRHRRHAPEPRPPSRSSGSRCRLCGRRCSPGQYWCSRGRWVNSAPPSRSPAVCSVTRTLPLEIYLQREVDRTPPWRCRCCWSWSRWRSSSRSGRGVDGERSGYAPGAGRRAGRQLRADVPARRVQLDLHVAAGRTMALVGPNGSGSRPRLTCSQDCCGHTPPRGGGDRVLFEVAAGRGPVLALHRRRIALLAQATTLFGNLDVRDNVAFGPRRRGMDRRAARARAMDWLEAVGRRRSRVRMRDPSPVVRPAGWRWRGTGRRPRAAAARRAAGGAGYGCAADMRHLLREHLCRPLLPAGHARPARRCAAGRSGGGAGGRPGGGVRRRRATVAPSAEPLRRRTLRVESAARRACDPDKIRTDEGWVVAGVPESDWQLGGRAAAVFRPADVALHEQSPTGSPRNVADDGAADGAVGTSCAHPR